MHRHAPFNTLMQTHNTHNRNGTSHSLLCAFEVGVVAKEDGEGHFHIHLTECCLSPFLHCSALIKAGGAATAPKWPWSAFETH